MSPALRSSSAGVVIGHAPKVLHVSPWFMPARSYRGVTEAVYRLCLAIARLGWEVRALTTDANGRGEVLPINTSHEHAASAGFEIRYCGRVMPHSVAPGLLRHLIPYVRWADVVHLTSIYSFPTIPTLIACRLVGRPLVWSPRGELHDWNGDARTYAKYPWELICRLAMPRNTLMHVTSDRERDESLARFSRLRVLNVPNGITVPADAARAAGDGVLRLGYIGRLDPRSGIENLVTACSNLIAAGMPVRLYVASDGDPAYEAKLRAKITMPELAAKVELQGPVSGAAKRRFFAETDILVALSHSDKPMSVVADALARGVAVLARKGTVWARVDEVGCGRCVDDNDPESLARTIREMAQAPLGEMGRRGRQWIVDEFSWARIARDMSDTYSAMIDGRISQSEAASESSFASSLNSH